jgi:type II secretory pathway component PulK
LKRRGVALIQLLVLNSILFLLAMAILTETDTLAQSVATQTRTVQARSMAQSGLDYARNRLQRGHWKQPTRFVSPLLPGHGTFEVQVSRTTSGGWEIRSQGRCGERQVELRGFYP